MIQDPRRETAAVATPVQRPANAKHYLRIEVTVPEEEDKLWGVVSDNGWSGRYLGKNIFLFAQEQVAKLQQAGVKFRTLD
jgi:hypothetical protein